MFHAPEGLGMQDPVPVPLIDRPDITRVFLPVSSFAVAAQRRIRAQILFFPFFLLKSDDHRKSLLFLKILPKTAVKAAGRDQIPFLFLWRQFRFITYPAD
jgi:hypothetical protein